MISKPWFDQYDPWVPHEIDADAYSNVVDMLMEAGERCQRQYRIQQLWCGKDLRGNTFAVS
jgi:hypothetical protein